MDRKNRCSLHTGRFGVPGIVDYFIGVSNVLPLQYGDGVYVIRAFSGVQPYYSSEPEDVAAINAMPDGMKQVYETMAINLVMMAVDIWDLFTKDAKRWNRAGMKKAAQNGARRISQELSNIESSKAGLKEYLRLIFVTAADMALGFMTAAPQGGRILL